MGAGLLAKAQCQSQRLRLTLSFREQARSHIDRSNMRTEAWRQNAIPTFTPYSSRLSLVLSATSESSSSLYSVRV